jgi:peptide chain release factor 3
MKTAADSNKISAELLREDKKLIENIKGLDNGMLVYDKKDRPVILVNNEWSLNWILERNPGIQFLTVPADVEKI